MDVNKKAITLLLETISIIVNDDKRPYRDKLNAILAECDDTDRTNLSEFLSWFDEVVW